MIIERVQKLLALARNKGATEAEAAQALKMANDLMLKHGIGQDTLDDYEAVVGWSGVNTNHTQRWHQHLAITVGRMYGCACIFERKTEHFQYAGREEANAASQLTFLFIVDQVNALYRISLPKGLSQKERAHYRKDFKHACTSRVVGRIQDIIEESMTDEGAAALGCTALVVQSHRKQREDEATDFIMAKPGSKVSTVSLSTRLTEAGVAGNIAGDQVQINAEVGGNDRKDNTRAGQHALPNPN